MVVELLKIRRCLRKAIEIEAGTGPEKQGVCDLIGRGLLIGKDGIGYADHGFGILLKICDAQR